MLRTLLFSLALLVYAAAPAFAVRHDASITTTTSSITVLSITENARDSAEPRYEGNVNIDGTFNGCTVHWLKSTDGGTNTSVVRDATGTAVTSTSEDTFPFSWGWPSGSASFIMYASVSGCSGTPALVIDVDDNLE